MKSLKGIDTVDSVLGKGKKLCAAGIGFVLKYCATSKTYPNKALTVQEVQELHSVGIKVGLLFESGNTADYFTASSGTHDGKIALAHALNLNAPKEACIYFAVDFDANHDQLPAIELYFEAVRNVMRPAFFVGAYGSGLVVTDLLNKGLIHYGMLANAPGWAGYSAAMCHNAQTNGIMQTMQPAPLGLNADCCVSDHAPGCW